MNGFSRLPFDERSAFCFNEQAYSFYSSQKLVIPKLVNGYLAVNKGTTTVIVNGFPLLPPPAVGLSGESTGLFGNIGEIYVGNNQQMDITFAAGVGGWVVIVFKFYVPNSL